MTNFIFKSANRLTKNLPITYDTFLFKITSIQKQNRDLRQDMVDIKLMINKLLIDKHLQMQVDDFYTKGSGDPEDWLLLLHSRLNSVEVNMVVYRILSSKELRNLVSVLVDSSKRTNSLSDFNMAWEVTLKLSVV